MTLHLPRSVDWWIHNIRISITGDDDGEEWTKNRLDEAKTIIQDVINRREASVQIAARDDPDDFESRESFGEWTVQLENAILLLRGAKLEDLKVYRGPGDYDQPADET